MESHMLPWPEYSRFAISLFAILSVLSTCVTIWAILRSAEPIGERIGQSGLCVLNRLFGLLLAAIAIDIVTPGLRSLFPTLA
jgi:multiple antibiotic resistance protein